MFIVNDMPVQITPELVSLLEKVETATIGHFLHSGFVDRELRAVLPEKRVAGTDQLPTECEILGCHAIDLAVHDGEVAHQLLDDIASQRHIVVVAQSFPRVGMLEQV